MAKTAVSMYPAEKNIWHPVPANSRILGPTISSAITYATKKTPDVVAPTIALDNVKDQNSGVKAAIKPKTTCITREMKNISFLPNLQKIKSF
jgi:hypothetical protein